MATLLLAEVANGRLNDMTPRALTAALELGAPVDVLVAGAGRRRRRGGGGQARRRRQGRVADDAAYAHGLAEPLAGADRRAGARL